MRLTILRRMQHIPVSVAEAVVIIVLGLVDGALSVVRVPPHYRPGYRLMCRWYGPPFPPREVT
jgi:hypothetical protein